MSQRWRARNEERDFLFAQLTSRVVNHSMRRPEDDMKWQDFSPTEMRKRFRGRPKRINRKRAAGQIRNFFGKVPHQ